MGGSGSSIGFTDQRSNISRALDIVAADSSEALHRVNLAGHQFQVRRTVDIEGNVVYNVRGNWGGEWRHVITSSDRQRVQRAIGIAIQSR